MYSLRLSSKVIFSKRSFSSLHTFFFLLLGYMLPWGWLALSCKFPRLTGKQGVWSVGGMEGTLGREKCKGSASRAASRWPVAALLPQPARSARPPPPQQHLRACQLGHASR